MVKNFGDLTQKAYLLEFGDDEDRFTFSVPPESEEFSYHFRNAETPTFGGLHVTQYGIDAVKIVLKGSTINNEIRLCGEKECSGEEEIATLRKLLQKYKNTVPDCNKPVILMDLSKEGVSWEVIIQEFTISRVNTKPFSYTYSITFKGFEPGTVNKLYQ
ncbi:hypothetical protein PilKf_01838 [Pillotina sp. SPG140]|jgi:2-phospho-L-lactate transferase/gluconeogenesis factor (CofD/UPF0052 family)